MSSSEGGRYLTHEWMHEEVGWVEGKEERTTYLAVGAGEGAAVGLCLCGGLCVWWVGGWMIGFGRWVAEWIDSVGRWTGTTERRTSTWETR